MVLPTAWGAVRGSQSSRIGAVVAYTDEELGDAVHSDCKYSQEI